MAITRRGTWIVATAVLIAAVVALTLAQRRPDDRFGDPAVLEQIKTMNCGELRDLADAPLRANTDEELDRAAGYANAANERMDKLDCFDR